jgi:hypothetical protein
MLRGKKMKYLEKNVLQCYLPTANPIWTGLGSNPDIDGRQMCVEGDKFHGRHGRRATISVMREDVNPSAHATTC